MDNAQVSLSNIVLKLIKDSEAMTADLQSLLGYVLGQANDAEGPQENLKPLPVSIYLGAKCPTSRGGGGWGYYAQQGSALYEESGGEDNTTLPRMYLMAAIKAFESLKEPTEVKVFATEDNLINDIGGGLALCKASGWKRANKKEAANLDLLEVLFDSMQDHKITVKKAATPTEISNINKALDCALAGMYGT